VPVERIEQVLELALESAGTADAGAARPAARD
jgi:hypothetical protein